MNFSKKFDHDDILSYLPDNFTIGSSDYFDKKFKSRLPSYLCNILEVKSRKEYSNDDENARLIKQIFESRKEFNCKLEKELLMRLQEGVTEEFYPNADIRLQDAKEVK